MKIILQGEKVLKIFFSFFVIVDDSSKQKFWIKEDEEYIIDTLSSTIKPRFFIMFVHFYNDHSNYFVILKCHQILFQKLARRKNCLSKKFWRFNQEIQ
jgi:hypothetical protein